MSGGRWVWCPAGWKVVPMMADKSWLGDCGSVPTPSEWEEAVRNAPEPPIEPGQEVMVTEWAKLHRELDEARHVAWLLWRDLRERELRGPSATRLARRYPWIEREPGEVLE